MLTLTLNLIKLLYYVQATQISPKNRIQLTSTIINMLFHFFFVRMQTVFVIRSYFETFIYFMSCKTRKIFVRTAPTYRQKKPSPSTQRQCTGWSPGVSPPFLSRRCRTSTTLSCSS